METTIKKWGNSQGVRLPKSVLEFMGLDIDDKVEIVQRDNEILLKKPDKNPTLDSIFKDYEGGFPDKCDWGEPRGREVW